MGMYRIESNRCKFHQYDDGVYYVTVCTKEKKHFFGKVIGGKRNITKLRNILNVIRCVGRRVIWIKIRIKLGC